MSGWRWWLTVGAVMAGLAVVLGAFGAHGADRYVAKLYKDAKPKTVAGFEVPTSWKRLQDLKTGAYYQMIHALGLLVVGLVSRVLPKKSVEVAGWSFLSGIFLFSGTLYLLTLTGKSWWGAITPIGGVLFIVGWVALSMAVCPCSQTDSTSTDGAVG